MYSVRGVGPEGGPYTTVTVAMVEGVVAAGSNLNGAVLQTNVVLAESSQWKLKVMRAFVLHATELPELDRIFYYPTSMLNLEKKK